LLSKKACVNYVIKLQSYVTVLLLIGSSLYCNNSLNISNIKMKNSLIKKINSDKINLHKKIKIILKVILGFGIIAALFFISTNIAHHKFSRLSSKVSAILEPSIKLVKLKEISDCLYGAEANVKAYTINQDTVYLLKYENYINFLNSRLDTLLYMSSEGGIVDINQAKINHVFALQIDTLSQLINLRLDLFNEYIELKAGENSQDVLLQLLKKIKIKKYDVNNKSEQSTETHKKSFFSQLFSSNKNKIYTKDAAQKNILNIITQSQKEEQIKEDLQLSVEVKINKHEYVVMNSILFLLKNMEEKELTEGINRIKMATNETTTQISLISYWFALFGLILALMFSYFIYIDIRKVRRFNELILFAKVNAEKLAAQYSLSLIEASLDPLITINSEGKITDMNEATVNITGLSREYLTGSDFFDYFTDSQKAREVYQDVFKKGSVSDFPLVLRHKDGKLTDVLFNGSVYKDYIGNVLGVVVVARDITNQIIFENELIEAKRYAEKATIKAEDSNRLIEAFLANMSHEIRTPMNAIMGFSDLLSKRKLEEKEKQYVTAIKSAGENLLTIINDILDISKIEAGMMSFESVTFSVKETLKSLNLLLSKKAKDKNLDLLFSCDKNVPDVVLGDHMRLTQIIINLVDNAIKFTKNGSVQLHTKVLNNREENTVIEFSIKDTGIGIPQDKMEQIFERFRQAEEAYTTRLYGGTGLGLCIAKQLVELQGGTLSVKSELNVGSVFTFCVPYKKASQLKVPSGTVQKKCNMEELSKLNILLVEDSQLNVQLILSLFSEYNLKLQTAENGSVCIEKLKENNGSTPLTTCFDIILMDMEMPVMNGYEATIKIRKELKDNIPIIAMTAHAMAGEKDKVFEFRHERLYFQTDKFYSSFRKNV